MAEQLPGGGLILLLSTGFTRTFYFGTVSQTVTVNISKNGGAFAGAAGVVAEVGGAGNGNGWYTVALTTGDTNTSGVLAYHCTAASGGPSDFADVVGGGFSITSNIKKNTGHNGFMFVMTQLGTLTPLAGLGTGVSGTVALDRSAFTGLTNAVTEIANGWYGVDLAAADVNGNNVALRFTAAGANDTNLGFITQP